ncbi:MAG: putative glycoside hydrolase [Oscillospiraceae bacterium]|nr:putative glycoside hydrolase [Oscillospiraceae bacterium]
MSNRSNGSSRSARSRQGRLRAPMVSVFVAAGLIIAGLIVIAVRYKMNDDEENIVVVSESGVDLDVSSSDDENSSIDDTPSIIYIDNNPVGTQSSLVPKGPAVSVRGMYIDPWTAGAKDELPWILEICDSSQINAIVIDIKEDNGSITYLSDNERLSDVCINVLSDIDELMEQLKEHGIYTIARLVCFKDPKRAILNPELAISNARGEIWYDNSGVAWLDPYNKDAWEYIAVIAKEAARIGFDEVQLDYVRFPTEGNLSQIDYGSIAEEKTKAMVISEFISYIREELGGTSARLSADVFGIIAVGKGDFEGIGQDLELMWDVVDAVSPMIYPSHFSNVNQNGIGQVINGILFPRPDLNPYGVVYNILLMTKERLPEDEGDYAVVRPYLQAFTASYLGSGNYQVYGASQVMEQINAVYDAGFDEWILWNHSGRYEVYRSLASLLVEVEVDDVEVEFEVDDFGVDDIDELVEQERDTAVE